jgi:hypothetical protein
MLPNPIEYHPLGKTDNQIINNRKITCKNYSDCLNLVIQNRWKGFSCGRCEAFSYINLEPYHGYGAARDGFQPEEIYDAF